MVRVLLAIACVASLFAKANCAVGDTVDDLTAQLSYFSRQLQRCHSTKVFQMNLHSLVDRNVTCNDGTKAGYYLRRAHGSKRWIIFLEGGWFCNSSQSCAYRLQNMGDLMSSRNWQKTKIGSGILSPHMDENPSWWNTNQVYVPYCSSDAWSGNVSRWESGEDFSFMGTRILDRVIESLLPKGLFHANHLLLAGSSAGGIGVILNLDRIAARLKSAGSKVKVRGLADSGWYLNETPLSPKCQGTTGNCGPAQVIKQGMNYWRGNVPEQCVRSLNNPDEAWKCYFGEYVYPTLQHPLFVFQWLYDEAQLAWMTSGKEQLPAKPTQEEILYYITLGMKLGNSFKNKKVCAAFVPSCISHTVLTRNDWLQVTIHGNTLNDALDAWYQNPNPNTVDCSTPPLVDDCGSPLCNPTCSTRLSTGEKQGSESEGVPLKLGPNGYRGPKPIN